LQKKLDSLGYTSDSDSGV